MSEGEVSFALAGIILLYGIIAICMAEALQQDAHYDDPFKALGHGIFWPVTVISLIFQILVKYSRRD